MLLGMKCYVNIPQVSDEYLIVKYYWLSRGLYVAECGHLKLHTAHIVGIAPDLVTII
jgi:hypothetical protein